MSKIKTLEEAKALVAEYRALPVSHNDPTIQLNWQGINRLPNLVITCSQCGRERLRPLDLDAVMWMVDHNEFNLETTIGACVKCEPIGDEADDEND